MSQVQSVFKRHFGYTAPHVVQVPGRLELLGNHADPWDGLSMSLAIDRYVFVAAGPRLDGRIELVSSAVPQSTQFWLTELDKDARAPWTHTVKGVLRELRQAGVNFSGFNAAIHSTIPLGIGMGSSAALAVATALIIRALSPYTLTELGAGTAPRRTTKGHLPPLKRAEKMCLARACLRAEQKFLGVEGWLLDPVACLLGKAWNVVGLDPRFNAVEYNPLIGIAVVACDSGVRCRDRNPFLRDLRRHAEAATTALRTKSLRSVEPAYLAAHRKALSGRQHEVAYHIVGEIQRVVAAERALREEDYAQFGQYLYLSHESSRDFLRCSAPELDLLVGLARGHRGCLGARLTGRGLGGATINLVHYHQVEDFIGAMTRAYQARTGNVLKPIVCPVVDGPK